MSTETSKTHSLLANEELDGDSKLPLYLGEVLRANLVMVVSCATAVALLSTAISWHLPDVYQSRAVLAPVSKNSQSSLMNLSSQYGGLASLAGVNIGNVGGGVPRATIALERIKSFDFFRDHMLRNDGRGYNFEGNAPVSEAGNENLKLADQEVASHSLSAQELHQGFLKNLRVFQDRSTGIITITLESESSASAKHWLDLIIKSISDDFRQNDIQEAEQSIRYLKQQIEATMLVNLQNVFSSLIEEQTKTLMLAEASADYVFTVIDAPLESEKPIGPRRLLIVALSTVLSVLVTFGMAVGRDLFRRYVDH